MERTEIIRDLRLGVFDVLVGINLLREGLDIPEVSLVAILDADKEGLLRSETALIQTIGRAARNVNGKVIMYAEKITKAMQTAIDETNRRRSIQEAYNRENGIEPKSVQKTVRDLIQIGVKDKGKRKESTRKLSPKQKAALIEQLNTEMREAAAALDFEQAAIIRDRINALKDEI